MTVTSQVLRQLTLQTTAQTTQYTSTSTKTIVGTAYLYNSGASPATIDVNVVPNGVGAGPANVLIKARSVPAGQTVALTELFNMRLNSGDFISTKASDDTSLFLRLDGREVS